MDDLAPNVISLIGLVLGSALFSFVPVCIAGYFRSRHAAYSLQELWAAVRGFTIFNVGWVATFLAMWAMAGGGHMSARTYWSGSVLLLIATLLITGALHVLSLPKSPALAFFIVPMLCYWVDMRTNFAHGDLVSGIWWTILVVLPLMISACWIWREVRADE